MALLGPWTIDPSQMRRPTLRTTTLVIDGYPRSANTFATGAFLYAQGHRGSFANTRIDIANHWHRPSQFTLAARWNVPAIALIREPRGAILSNLIFSSSDDAAWFTNRYLLFYRTVERVRDKVMVIDFKDAIADMGQVIRRVNERYGTGFTPFEHTPENVATVQAMLEAHAKRPEKRFAVPTAERDALKKQIAHILDTPQLEAPLREAQALHERLTRP